MTSHTSLNLSEPRSPFQANENNKNNLIRCCGMGWIITRAHGVLVGITPWDPSLFLLTRLHMILAKRWRSDCEPFWSRRRGWAAPPLPPPRSTVAVHVPSGGFSPVAAALSPVAASPGCHLHPMSALGLPSPSESTRDVPGKTLASGQSPGDSL